MSTDDCMRTFHPFTLGMLILFGIVELSISASLVSMYNRHHNYLQVDVRNSARFLLFASTWSVLFCAVFLGLFLHDEDGSAVTSVIAHLGFLVLTWIFWTAGAIAITVALDGGHNCSNIRFYLPYCSQLNALEAFAWIEWVIATLALIGIITVTVRAVRRRDGQRAPVV